MAMLIIINGYTHWILEQTQVACADIAWIFDVLLLGKLVATWLQGFMQWIHEKTL